MDCKLCVLHFIRQFNKMFNYEIANSIAFMFLVFGIPMSIIGALFTLLKWWLAEWAGRRLKVLISRLTEEQLTNRLVQFVLRGYRS